VPKKNRTTAAKNARAAQQADSDAPYTELLRAAQAASSAVEPASAPAAPTTSPSGDSRMPWTATTLARIDDEYDRDNADRPGGSRFAAYVRKAQKDFNPWDDEILDPVEFAVAAWRTATCPVMSPGYVRHRPDLQRITAHRDDWDGRLVLVVAVPLRHYHLGGPRLPYQWADWQEDRYVSSQEYPQLVEPEPSDIAVLTSTAVKISAKGWPLPTPTATEGPELVAQVKQMLEVVVDNLNREAGPIVARLLGEQA